VFFCKYNDPIYVKMEKLETIIRLVSDRNIEQVHTTSTLKLLISSLSLGYYLTEILSRHRSLLLLLLLELALLQLLPVLLVLLLSVLLRYCYCCCYCDC
jgi:hypothetical protein